MAKIKAGIIGGTGYTGVELLRLLAGHPQVELAAITSRQEAGQAVGAVFPNLRGHVDLCFSKPDDACLSECDVVFFATPHATAMHQVPALLDAGIRVVDLSADFRIKNPDVWAQWYGEAHVAPQLLEEAVYGLPEVNRQAIADARLVACAGCYPTAIQLGFLPLLKQRIVDARHLIADAKSGVSGAGRTAKLGTLFPEAADNMGAYSVNGHRHLPEILQGLQAVTSDEVALTFVPHLTPMIRGIQATLYAQLTQEQDLQELFEHYYQDEPFVDVMPAGASPQTRSVRGSNYCRIAVTRPDAGNTVVVLSVIDNLVKGASGQAIQCFNLMFGLTEGSGLQQIALLP